MGASIMDKSGKPLLWGGLAGALLAGAGVALVFLLGDGADARPRDAQLSHSLKGEGWDGDRISFQTRLKYFRAMEKTRHHLRLGTGGIDFDTTYPPDKFIGRVRLEVGKIRILAERFNIRFTDEQLNRELARINHNSKNRLSLDAIKVALDRDPRILRHCLAEPLLANGRLRQIFAAKPDVFQTAALRRIKRLQDGLTADNFRVRAGDGYREVTFVIDPQGDPSPDRPGGPMPLPPKLHDVFAEQLQAPGDITRRVNHADHYVVFKLLSRDEKSYRVAMALIRQLPYNEWVRGEVARMVEDK